MSTFYTFKLMIGYYMNWFRVGLVAPDIMDVFEDMGF